MTRYPLQWPSCFPGSAGSFWLFRGVELPPDWTLSSPHSVGIWPEPIYKGQSGVSVNTFNPVKSVTGRYENVHSAWDVISNEPYVPPPAPAYA